jgi:hypothetical protein
MGMSGPGSTEEEFRAGEGTYWRGRGSMLTTRGGQWSGQLWLQGAANRRKERACLAGAKTMTLGNRELSKFSVSRALGLSAFLFITLRYVLLLLVACEL